MTFHYAAAELCQYVGFFKMIAFNSTCLCQAISALPSIFTVTCQLWLHTIPIQTKSKQRIVRTVVVYL